MDKRASVVQMVAPGDHGTAAEAVYFRQVRAPSAAPQAAQARGWWKYNDRADRVGRPVHYALLVLLATPEVTTDLYTATAVMLDVPVPTDIGVQTQAVTTQLSLDW
ncbi:hypothetical protein ACIHEI_21175 [Kitasatospora sp. NPDC051984]|uniref:hypothetical protein n=1 Tax=Kitasatospora sp. NPDC051984 TaxID=3364059 RepID=UPI0037C943AA